MREIRRQPGRRLAVATAAAGAVMPWMVPAGAMAFQPALSAFRRRGTRLKTAPLVVFSWRPR